MKDLCIFQGTLISKNGLEEISDEQYIQIFSEKTQLIDNTISYDKKISKITSDNSLSGCTIYHYPSGKKEMRINSGTLVKKGTYKIRTLEGSSGAPIFVYSRKHKSDILLGIHTGAIENKKDTTAIPPRSILSTMFGTESACVYTFAEGSLHAFEDITIEIYNKILSNVNLYDLKESQLYFLHAKLLCNMITITRLSPDTSDQEISI